MAMSFDFEPEDSYDASDPPLVRARNVIRRLRLLDNLPDPRTNDLRALLAIIEHRAGEIDLRSLDDRARLRLEQIIGDLALLQEAL